MTDLTNKVTLITGGARGLGRLVAHKMAAKGSHLVLWDMADESLANTAREISAVGHKVTTYHCDVSNREMVYGIANKVKQDVGKVDILINNAGIVSGGPFLECSDQQLERTVEVNLLAHFWTVKAFLPHMVETNSGHIVTVASAGGIVGSSGLVDYSASKFGAFGFHEALRAELKKQNLKIHTTVVCPFFIKSEMFAGVKTRFPFLLPILDAERVSQRIVDAIIMRKQRVIMPPLVYATWPLRLLPVSIFDKLASFLGINDAMSEFQGRRS
ncbi:MAG: SDR family oxidoreductase [Deltaproteobacteria bacterium]|nr:SDR family oxidoreductase [Deltaproteobacteria bacterium]